jgi:hypothetical protein
MPEKSDRFALEWLMPQEPGLATYVVLLDAERHPDHVLDVGHGGDEAEALLDLWTTLVVHDQPEDAVACVVEAFTRRTGRAPGEAAR